MSIAINKPALLQAYRTIEALEARLAETTRLEAEPIAIAGIGCRFAGGVKDPATFWRLLRNGVDATCELPEGRWDRGAWFDPNPDAEGKLYVDRGGYIESDPGLFDASFFGINPREAAAMDPQQRLLLRVAWEAIEDAHIPADALRETETGVYVGLMTNDYARLQVEHQSVRHDGLYLGGGTGISFLAGRLSFTLGCQGPSMVVATACSSSLVALHLAANALRSGECNLALAGGVNLILSPEPTAMLSRMRALAPDGRCKSFADGADGYSRGEGCGVVVLQRLSDAERDGRRIYALLHGSATNHGGPSGGLTIPSGPAQEKVVRKALANARVKPETVAYVEAHGTGTDLGDPIEAAALGRIWKDAGPARLSLGSVKTNIGHTEAAAGIAGVIKTALALHHGEIPASLHCEKPSAHVPWAELPLEVNTAQRPWPEDRPHAGVSSFGLSGINAHAILGRAPRQPSSVRSKRSHHLLAISGKSPAARSTLAREYSSQLSSGRASDWPEVAAVAAHGRAHCEHRVAVNASSRDEAVRLLGLDRHPRTTMGRAVAEPDAGVAFVFSGPGSQYECMALDLHESEPFFRETLTRLAGEVPSDKPLLDVIFPPPGFPTPLNEPSYASRALFAVELALAQLWMCWGVRPRFSIGNSEIAAQLPGQVLSSEDGIRVAYEAGCRHFVEIGPHVPGRSNIGGSDCRWLSSLVEGRPDWEVLNQSVAALYVDGFSIDWKSFQPDVVGTSVSLPLYPFEEKRYWIEQRSKSEVSPWATRPSLLGERIESPLEIVQYRSEMGVRSLPWLAGHRMLGRVLLPAAAYLEMISSALAGYIVEDLQIESPCFLPEDRNIKLQTLLEPKAGGDFSFSIHSYGKEWTRHCVGSARRGGAGEDSELLAALRARVQTPVDVTQFYIGAAGQGVEYGPPFQSILELWRGDGEALSRLSAPGNLTALLDGALQTGGAALEDEPSRYLPVGIGSFQWAGESGANTPNDVWVHARNVSAGPGTRTFEYVLYSSAGERLGHILGMVAREPGHVEEPPEDWLYTTKWESSPRVSGPGLSNAADISEAVAVEAKRWPMTGYEDLRTVLNARARYWAAEALRQVQPLEVAPQHRRLFEHLRLQGLAAPQRPEPLVNKLPSTPALDVLDRCGQALPRVLRGEVNALNLLFPATGVNATRLYETDLASLALNSMAREALSAAVAYMPVGRKIRVLEAGAGTGGTTPHLLSVLPVGRAEFCFTDVSPYFTEQAKEKFRAYPFLSTHLFDIERDPAAQGFDANSFDIVVAANVVHATADARGALRNLQTLLAPGGILLLIEATEPALWLDLTFGLTEGWWNFRDADLRPNYPLLSEQMWSHIAADLGFASVSTHSVEGQSLLLCAMPAASTPAQVDSGTWLVLSDGGGVGDAVASRLRAEGARVIAVKAGHSYRQIGHDSFELSPSSSAEMQLFGMEHLTGSRLAGVVHLWALDPAPPPNANICLPVLNLLRNLIRGNLTPRVWIATRNAVAARSNDSLTGWDQSQLWGMAQAAYGERPSLHLACVDLEDGLPETQADAVCSEIASPSHERHIAYRGKDRYAARLTRAPREIPAIPTGSGPVVLKGAKGSLDELHWESRQRRTPGPGEIEIEVRAAGLNFLDVLDGLGTLPFEREWLGGECSGVVTAVGSGVTEFRPGDEAVALVPGAFASYAIADARVAAHKPRRLSFAEAASFPVAFLTAKLALGDLKQGQRVLIHAISGGTGLAAWQLAKRAGAETMGTASPVKWDALRAMGMTTLMNSRRASFESETLAHTQGRGVDLVLNSLTGDHISAGLRTLAPGGRFVEIGKSELWSAGQVAHVRSDVRYQAVDLFASSHEDPATAGRALRELAAAFEDGSLTPLPVTVFAAGQAVGAFRMMQQARHIGKIVVSMDAPPASVCQSDATYLIAGGSSDLGLLTADYLVSQGARHIVLASRRASEAALGDAVEPLRQRGCSVTFASVNLANRDDAAELVRRIREEMPALRGIVHAAGLVDDGLLDEMDWSRFERVLGPKVQGAWNLHELTLAAPLDFFMVYSSVASLFGSPGQANHAAANAFLDGLTSYRKRRGLPGRSIEWGAWSELGAAARVPQAVRERQRQMGMGSIPTEKGTAFFDRLWKSDTTPMAVAPIDWKLFAPRTSDQPFFAEFQKSELRPAVPSETVAGLRGDSLRQRLSALLVDELRTVLGQDRDWIPDEEQGFFGLGMDSLTSLELRNRLEKLLGLTLSQTLLFDCPMPGDLVAHLASQLDAPVYGKAADVASREIELDGLGAEELASLLTKKLAAMETAG